MFCILRKVRQYSHYLSIYSNIIVEVDPLIVYSRRYRIVLISRSQSQKNLILFLVVQFSPLTKSRVAVQQTQHLHINPIITVHAGWWGVSHRIIGVNPGGLGGSRLPRFRVGGCLSRRGRKGRGRVVKYYYNLSCTGSMVESDDFWR